MEASSSSQALPGTLQRSLIQYVWPPVLAANSPGCINVCFSGALRSEICVTLKDPATGTILLDARARIPNSSCNTCTMELAPRRSCCALLLTAEEQAGDQDTSRGPFEVPLLVLPELAANEINALFDQFVRLELHDQAPLPSPAAPGSSQDAARLAAQAVEKQNLLVGGVYRSQILPFIQDIQEVLHGSQDLVIWIRLSALLRQWSLQHCMLVLKDIMKAPPLGNVATSNTLNKPGASERGQQTLVSRHSDSSNKSGTATRSSAGHSSSTNAKYSAASQSGLPPSNLSNPTQSSGRAGSTSSRTSSSIYHSLPNMGTSPLDNAVWEGTVAMMQSMDDGMTWHREGDASEPGSASTGVGTRGGRTGVIDNPLSGLIDTDEELMLLSNLYHPEALLPGSGNTDLMLTTYVPVQQEHMHEYPHYTLFDPDNPASQPASLPTSQPVSSSSVSYIHGVVQASQELSKQLNEPVIVLSEGGHSPSVSPSTSRPLNVALSGRPGEPSAAAPSTAPTTPSGTLLGSSSTPKAVSSPPEALSTGSVRRRLMTGEAHTTSSFEPHSSQDSAWSNQATQASTLLAPSIQAAWRGCVGGFGIKQLEKQFMSYWSKSMWFSDSITLSLTLLLMVSSLQTSVILGAAGHHQGGMLIMTGFLGGPLLVGSYMLVVHGKTTVKYREAITAVSRLINACCWIVAMGLKLHHDVHFLNVLMTSWVARLMVIQIKSIIRPLLLRSAVLCGMMESFCLASIAEHTSTQAWLLEMLLLWCSMLAVSAAIDTWRRWAFLSMLHKKPPNMSLLVNSSSSSNRS